MLTIQYLKIVTPVKGKKKHLIFQDKSPLINTHLFITCMFTTHISYWYHRLVPHYLIFYHCYCANIIG